MTHIRYKKFVFIGPESSGKTTLCNTIAGELDVEAVHEFARDYLEQNGATYGLKDVGKMLKGQINLESQIEKEGFFLKLYDTDILNYWIWYNFKYGFIPEGLEERLEEITDRYYFLCAPDFPWKKDELRENPGDQWEIFSLFEKKLNDFYLPYNIVRGPLGTRSSLCLEIIRKLNMHNPG